MFSYSDPYRFSFFPGGVTKNIALLNTIVIYEGMPCFNLFYHYVRNHSVFWQ